MDANTSVYNLSVSNNSDYSNFLYEYTNYPFFFFDYYYYYNNDDFNPSNHPSSSFYEGDFYHSDLGQDSNSINSLQDSHPLVFAVVVICWLTFAVGLPITCLAAIALYCQVRPDQVAPLFVINLLISDLIQIVARPAMLMKINDMAVSKLFYNQILKLLANSTDQSLHFIQKEGVSAMAFVVFHFAILTSIGFMVCISLERYLLVAHPLWYHCQRTIKRSVLVSTAVWGAAFAYLTVFLILVGTLTCKVICVYQSIYFFLPFPLFLFCFFGTWRTLSRSVAVPFAEKKKILLTLAIVLAKYTLVFLPSILFLLWKHLYSNMESNEENIRPYKNLNGIAMILLFISPLLDVLLYIFIGKNPKELLGTFNSRARRQTISMEDTRTVHTVSELAGV